MAAGDPGLVAELQHWLTAAAGIRSSFLSSASGLPAGLWTPEQPCDLPERHNQVHRDAKEQRNRHLRHDEPDQDRDHVPDDDGQKSSPCVLFLAASVLREEVLAPGVGIQGRPQEADRQQCQPVDRDGHAFGADMVQGFGDEPGRERPERHDQLHEDRAAGRPVRARVTWSSACGRWCQDGGLVVLGRPGVPAWALIENLAIAWASIDRPCPGPPGRSAAVSCAGLWTAQDAPIWTASALIGVEPTPAQIGGSALLIPAEGHKM